MLPTSEGIHVARITVEEATVLADQWQSQREDHDHAPRASYYNDVGTHDLIKMWETRKRIDGKKLNNWEFGCLVEAWTQRFGDLPPFDAVANSVALLDHAKEELCLPMTPCCGRQK